ncbi:hypothetical protein QYE76_022997 [Lolium multiflorum]|uniref:Integrase catalytic domain-containing protein n=1 Tax=Lolium multiflorum TaxID=4521 RepID=A0AAD8VUC2_LOLMU|nr:hypothetical protein QYE76_022997 [Lolium multiflorum]
MIQTPRRDVAVCLAVVVLGRLRPATPGLAAAWRCRVRLVPPCRHGHAAVLCSSKWIEAKPVRKADGATALKFVCSLVMRFGIPHSIITNNGTNFAQGELRDYCDTMGIRLDLASVAHPQSNGQVERANGLILSGIKPALKNRCDEQPELGLTSWKLFVEFTDYP